MSSDIKLGGRLFSFVNYAAITSLNEHYVMKLMRETGLDRVVPVLDEESDAAYLARLQAAMIDTLRTHELLAGYLLPLGKGEPDWDLQMARHTALFLQKLSDPDDKAEIQRLALSMVFDFFRQGLASLPDSLNYSGPPETSPPTTSETTQPIAEH